MVPQNWYLCEENVTVELISHQWNRKEMIFRYNEPGIGVLALKGRNGGIKEYS